MDELERMLRGEEYFGNDEKLMKMKADTRRFCELYNSSEEDQRAYLKDAYARCERVCRMYETVKPAL